MLYLLVVSMTSCLFTGVLSRSVPFVPLGCHKAFMLTNECTSQISPNISAYVSFEPIHFADNYMDEVCSCMVVGHSYTTPISEQSLDSTTKYIILISVRGCIYDRWVHCRVHLQEALKDHGKYIRVFGEYRKCIEGDYTYVENNCPSGFVTLADAVIRSYTSTCKTYKADQAAFIPCMNNNKEVRDEVTVCLERLSEKAHVGGIEYITDCRFVDDLIKCHNAFEQCDQPQHFTRLMKYLEETRGDVCYIATTLMGYRD